MARTFLETLGEVVAVTAVGGAVVAAACIEADSEMKRKASPEYKELEAAKSAAAEAERRYNERFGLKSSTAPTWDTLSEANRAMRNLGWTEVSHKTWSKDGRVCQICYVGAPTYSYTIKFYDGI